LTSIYSENFGKPFRTNFPFDIVEDLI